MIMLNHTIVGGTVVATAQILCHRGAGGRPECQRMSLRVSLRPPSSHACRYRRCGRRSSRALPTCFIALVNQVTYCSNVAAETPRTPSHVRAVTQVCVVCTQVGRLHAIEHFCRSIILTDWLQKLRHFSAEQRLGAVRRFRRHSCLGFGRGQRELSA